MWFWKPSCCFSKMYEPGHHVGPKDIIQTQQLYFAWLMNSAYDFLFPSVFLGKMIIRSSFVKKKIFHPFSGALLTFELFSKTSLGTLWIIVFVRDMRNSEDLFCSKPSMMYMKDRARLFSHMLVSCQKDAVYVGRIQEYDSFASSIWANP